MSQSIEHVDVLEEGIVLFLSDGREAYLTHGAVIELAEATHAFENLTSTITLMLVEFDE